MNSQSADLPGPPSRSSTSPRRSELIAVAFLLALALGRLDADLLVVLLERRQVLARLRELAFLHALADVPVHEGTLRIHQIELVVDAREHLSDGRGVADHAARAHHLGKIATRDNGRRLVVDAALESCRTPVDELNGPLSLDGGHGRIHVLWHDIPAVHHAARHVVAVARVALD